MGRWSPSMDWCVTWPHSTEDSVLWYCVKLLPPSSDATDSKLHWRRVSSIYGWAADCPWPTLDERHGLCSSPSSQVVSASSQVFDRPTDPVDSGKIKAVGPLDLDKFQRAPKPSHKHGFTHLSSGAVSDAPQCDQELCTSVSYLGHNGAMK